MHLTGRGRPSQPLTRVPQVQLAVPLAPRENNLLCVDHHAHIAAVLAGRKRGLVLALQDLCQLRRQAPDDLRKGVFRRVACGVWGVAHSRGGRGCAHRRGLCTPAVNAAATCLLLSVCGSCHSCFHKHLWPPKRPPPVAPIAAARPPAGPPPVPLGGACASQDVPRTWPSASMILKRSPSKLIFSNPANARCAGAPIEASRCCVLAPLRAAPRCREASDFTELRALAQSQCLHYSQPDATTGAGQRAPAGHSRSQACFVCASINGLYKSYKRI